MSGRRVGFRELQQVAMRLSERDQRVLAWVAALRLVTGKQLEPLVFAELQGHSRSVIRGRVLGRLVRWQLLEIVDHRVGGPVPGSSSPVYQLTHAGQQLLNPEAPRPTKPYTPRFTLHTLAVSQLAADLVPATAATDVQLRTFQTEPGSWVPDGLGSFLKPDAYLLFEGPELRLHFWVEIDTGTESIPTVERKLSTYLDFVARGQLGPAGLVPRVLISTSTEERAEQICQLVDQLPVPAPDLFGVTTSGRAVVTLLEALKE